MQNNMSHLRFAFCVVHFQQRKAQKNACAPFWYTDALGSIHLESTL